MNIWEKLIHLELKVKSLKRIRQTPVHLDVQIWWQQDHLYCLHSSAIRGDKYQEGEKVAKPRGKILSGTKYIIRPSKWLHVRLQFLVEQCPFACEVGAGHPRVTLGLLYSIQQIPVYLISPQSSQHFLPNEFQPNLSGTHLLYALIR